MAQNKGNNAKISLGQIVKSKNKVIAPEAEKFFLDEIDDFQKFLRYEKRYSAYNVFQLVHLTKRISRVYSVFMPCLEDAYRIEDDLRSNGIKSSTIKHYLRILELMAEYKEIPLKIRKPKATYAIPKSLNREEARQLLESCDNLRDKAVISVLLYCGLRAKELTALHVEDVDLKKRLLHIKDRGNGIKNRHERQAVISSECADDLKNWLQARPQSIKNNYLFVTVYGDNLSVLRLNRIVKKVVKNSGLDESISTHKLRHTCASNLLKSGIPITEVSLQLGHRSLSSTMIYLHGNIQGLQDSIDKRFHY